MLLLLMKIVDDIIDLFCRFYYKNEFFDYCSGLFEWKNISK